MLVHRTAAQQVSPPGTAGAIAAGVLDDAEAGLLLLPEHPDLLFMRAWVRYSDCCCCC
jgi:hypothetical protein